MKKAFPMLSLVTLMFLAFAFTPANATTNVTPEMDTCNEMESVVSTADLFGSGKFYGCYITAAPGATVTYALVPQVPGNPTITGTIDCQPDFVTITPFVEYDIFITTNDNIWLFLQWEICFYDSVPGVSLTPGTTNVGSIYVTC